MAAALGIWAILAQMLAGGGGAIQRLASPLAVGEQLASYATDGMVADLRSSLAIFVAGWLGGGILAALVGLLLGRVTLLGRMFLPIIEAIRPVSSIAWVPLSIVWFGFGFSSKVFLVGLAVFLVVIVYAVDGCTRIPGELVRTSTMLGMSPMQRFRNLILPGTLSEVLIGFRVGLMAGWGTVIVAELVAADAGLGAHLMAVQRSYDIAAVMATMLCFAIAGFLMTVVFTWVERRLLPWRLEEQR
ncbi:ABC transporter permease [Haloactinopolyspora alba]|uniref:ABC transporter permease n=1 Tax=Haloactinopolyspora alba TaxID=648780 RepID=UPI00101C86D8|nr:ABC transporter permease subunit [Haloactinopolyspora alba]